MPNPPANMAVRRARRFAPSLTRSNFQGAGGRAWFVCCLALLGASTATAALIITLLDRAAAVRYPEQPEHFGIGSYLVLSIGAIAFGAAISGLWGYFVAQGRHRPRNIILWLAFGFAFGLILPVLTGFTVPTTTVLLQLFNGDTLPAGTLETVIDAMFRGIPFAFVHGTLGIFTGMLAGALFGLGGWIIDLAHSSRSPHISRYGSLAGSLLLSAALLGFVAFSPPTFLVNLG